MNTYSGTIHILFPRNHVGPRSLKTALQTMYAFWSMFLFWPGHILAFVASYDQMSIGIDRRHAVV